MAIVSISGNNLTFPTFVDLQFAATSSQNQLDAYVVNYQTDYRFLIQHQDYYRTTSGQPVISIVKSNIRAIITNVYAISALT